MASETIPVWNLRDPVELHKAQNVAIQRTIRRLSFSATCDDKQRRNMVSVGEDNTVNMSLGVLGAFVLLFAALAIFIAVQNKFWVGRLKEEKQLQAETCV